MMMMMMNIKGSPSCVVANVLDCDIVVSEFELQSRYYVHFQTNTLSKGIKLLIIPVVCEIVLLIFFCDDCFSI